jgi:hypothetical protein
MREKKGEKVILFYILWLMVSTSLSAYVNPIPGENLWRLVSRIGFTVDIIESKLDVITSLFDEMISDTEQLDADLLSVSDVLSSQLDKIDKDVESMQEILSSAIEHLDIDLLSIGDVLSSEIELCDTTLLSVSDVLTSLIDVNISAIESAHNFLSSKIDDINNALLSIGDMVQSELEVIDAQIVSSEDAILSAIEQLEDCTVGVPIMTVPYTIISPGLYHVCTDLTLTTGTSPLIAINASNVTLDLGGHTLSTGTSNYGVAIDAGSVNNIHVCNGSIAIGGTGTHEGVIVRSVNTIILEDLSIFNGPDALMSIGSNCDGVTIRRCIFNGNNGQTTGITNPGALYIDGLYSTPSGVTNNITVEDCVARDNVVRGFSCTNCTNLSVTNYTVYAAQSAGFRIDSGTNSIECVDCYVTNSCFGFNIINSTSILTHCSAVSSDTGFVTDPASTGAIFVECETSNNATGFNISGDNALLKRCVVANNTVGIFVDVGASNTQILDTCPVNNTTDYINNSTSTTFINLGTVFEVLLSAIDAIKPCCSLLDTLESSIDTTINSLASSLDIFTSASDVLAQCLVGTAITQSMIPLTITTPGSYTLCENVTSTGSGPSITINANNVTLDLNGHTITNTTDRGIVCNSIAGSFTNIDIIHGVIMPALEAVVVNPGCQEILIEDIQTIGAALTTFSIQSATAVTINSCTANNSNDTPINSTDGAFYVINSGQVSINSCSVSLCTIGVYVLDPTGSIEITGCSVTNMVSAGYFLHKTGVGVADTVVSNCYADGEGQPALGFVITGVLPNYAVGPILESCFVYNVAASGSGGFFLAGIQGCIMRNCVSKANSAGAGLSCEDVSGLAVYNMVAQANSTQGFSIFNGTNCTFRQCSAIGNVTGFFIDSSNLIVLDECLASGNSGSGIFNSGSTNMTILDTRSSNGATSINPAYNLNVTADFLDGATLIVTS